MLNQSYDLLSDPKFITLLKKVVIEKHFFSAEKLLLS